MTNKDKFLRDGVSVEELAKEFESFCEMLNEACIIPTYKQEMEQFLNCEIKPTLTEDERVILKHINKQFYYIKRIDGELQLTNKEHTWCDYELLVDDEVFQFIKERRRI